MARDTGKSPEEYGAADWKELVPSITDAPTLGEGLRIARDHSGRSLAELSSQTRVPSRYLTALEQNDFSILPNRVFSIGYVRAYASALGLDEQLAVERFKRESPDPSVPLQPPVGIAFEEVKRYSPRLIAGVAVLLCAVVGWNVFQRVNLMQAPQPSDIAEVPETWRLGTVPGQSAAMRLTAPHPAPPDQTIPALYITPGLEAQLTGIDPTSPEAVAAAAAAAPPVARAFNPRGAIYGASASASDVIIQARKAAAIVVRMADGRVLFARQLAAGEAWRAPAGVSAVIDATEFAAFDIYLNGEHGGALQAQQTQLAQLNTRAQTLARQAAAELAARAEAARQTAQAQLQAASSQTGG
ncbi:helix-turn-helix domain-containing protein [Brevundimonas sp. GCM10030266]|uniref:helix-turn-helix domain-containing protein n=1 Tax=Brevundimonas sp. GCM10030266 TaxID=3273386 RepID=UPI003606CBD8